MNMIRVLLLLSAVLFVGCGTNPMKLAPNQNLDTSSDQAQIVFMRSSFVGSAINASIYDVSDGQTKFIGIIGNATKVAYKAPPGKRVFMVVSEAADFMEGNLSAGKTYYSIITPRMGAWVARFSMWPIKKDTNADYHFGMDTVEQWKSSTQLMLKTPESDAWYESNKASVESKRQQYWPVWQQKTPEELVRRTLSPEDGI